MKDATFLKGLLVSYMILTQTYEASKQVLLPNSVDVKSFVWSTGLNCATTVSHLLLCASVSMSVTGRIILC